MNKTVTEARSAFIVLANARSGTTYLQSLIASLPGVATDFEYAWKPYGTRLELHRFISDGMPDVFEDIRKLFPTAAIAGSKFVLPILEYHSDEVVEEIVSSFSGEGSTIHLIREHWDILKSALARGVFHDFNSGGNGLDSGTRMYAALAQYDITGYGHDNVLGVQVDLSLEQLAQFLRTIVRNDYIFCRICDSCPGITLEYADLNEAYSDLQSFLRTSSDPIGFNRAVSNPIVKKLANIPDNKINHYEILQPLSDQLYRTLRDGKAAAMPADKIFDLQMAAIDDVVARHRS